MENNKPKLPYDNFYVREGMKIDGFRDQFLQLLRVTWDGDLIGKSYRDELVRLGFATKTNGGYNILTKSGIEFLHENGYIKS